MQFLSPNFPRKSSMAENHCIIDYEKILLPLCRKLYCQVTYDTFTFMISLCRNYVVSKLRLVFFRVLKWFFGASLIAIAE